MDMSKFSGETFLKVSDVKDGPLQEQIALVREGRFGKPDIVFESGSLFSINATNNRILCRAYGADSDAWAGKEIELYLGEIEFQKEMRPAVLIRPISPPIKKPKKPPAQKPDFNDEVAF
jgi:hypothetical protein